MTISAVVTHSLVGIAAFACLMGMFMPVAGVQQAAVPILDCAFSLFSALLSHEQEL